MAGYQDTLGMEYVYVSESTQEYVKAQVSLIMGDDETEIYIRPEQMVTCGELNSVLDYLENDIFKKLKMHVAEGCSVYVSFDGITYKAELDGGTAAAIRETDTP